MTLEEYKKLYEETLALYGQSSAQGGEPPSDKDAEKFLEGNGIIYSKSDKKVVAAGLNKYFNGKARFYIDPALPTFFVDDDTQMYTVSKDPQ